MLFIQIIKKQIAKIKMGFGGNAPNKLKAHAVGKGSELASDPCRRHGQKLVIHYFRRWVTNQYVRLYIYLNLQAELL